MEWWWNQPNVPEVVKFVADFRNATGKTPSARDWFGYVAVHIVRLGRGEGEVARRAEDGEGDGGHGAAAGRRAATGQGRAIAPATMS